MFFGQKLKNLGPGPKNKDFGKITDVADGEIFKRIKNVRQENKFIGDELWFVKTTF